MGRIGHIILVTVVLCIRQQQLEASKCKRDWSYHNGYCYGVTDSKLTWFKAQAKCRSEGGGADLASIHEPDENKYIIEKDGIVPTWIGLSSLDNGVYKWSDKTVMNYHNVMQESIDLYHPERQCTAMLQSGKWKFYNCSNAFVSMCKIKPLDFTTTSSPVVTKTPSVEGCPPNFHSVPGASQCYHVGGKAKISEHLNFTEAMDACQALQPGATLASIHSWVDQRFVTTLLDGLKAGAWIGLYVQNLTAVGFLFEWTDNTELNQVYWDRQQPFTYNPFVRFLETCTVMDVELNVAGAWTTLLCEGRQPYVCGHAKDPKFPVEIRYNKGCPTGFQKFRNSCYKYFNVLKTWSEAEATCVKQKGHLVSLHNKFETAFIELLMEPGWQTWIGLSYNRARRTFVWSDGWPVIFTDWFPKKMHWNNCVGDILDTGWQTVACRTKLPFVCEIDYDSVPKQPVITGACVQDWHPFEEYCYHVSLKRAGSWYQGKAHCGFGRNFASIHNELENRFITKVLQSYGYDAWIGLDQGEDGHYFWTDLSPLEFENWDDSVKISNFTGEKHCVAVSYKNNGKWIKRDCNDKLQYVCRMNQFNFQSLTRKASRSSVAPKTDVSSTRKPSRTTVNSVAPKTGVYSAVTSPKPCETNNVGSNTGMSGGEGAGITIGVIVILALVIAIAFWTRRYLQRTNTDSPQTLASFQNVNYNVSSNNDETKWGP